MTPEIEFITLMAHAKGFSHELTPLEPQHARPCIHFRGMQIEYLLPCIDLIDESRPYPSFYPYAEPHLRQVTRCYALAAVQATETILDRAYRAFYVDNRDRFCGIDGRSVHLIDLAVASLAPFRTDAWIQALRNQVNCAVEDLRTEATT